MKNIILISITFFSLLTLLQVLYYLYSSSPRSQSPKIYFSSLDLKNTPSAPNTTKVTCKAPDLYYTSKDLRRIFTPRLYSSCKTPTKDIIDFNGEEVYAKCEFGHPQFFADPGRAQRLGGEVKDPVTWSPTLELNNKSEYVFVRCGQRSVYTTVFNKFNLTISQRANEKRRELKADKKNFNVFLLVFDSLSRFVSYNFLPEFTSYLKEVGKEGNSVYEFKKIALPEEYTLPNMAEILYGETWDNLKFYLGGRKLPIEGEFPEHYKKQQEQSIWTHYSRLGFTTLFMYDTVWDFLSRFTGRDIIADHVFENYWRHAYDVYEWTDFSSKQRCMGHQNAHNISFKYVYEYFKNYKDNNKFAYVHLSPTHESSGNVRTLDSDLKIFVQSFLQLMKKRNENFVFYIISDHGWKFPDLILDVRYKAEILSPMTYLIMNKEVEDKMKAKEMLEYNKERLNSRYDLNLALKYLAYYPFNVDKEELNRVLKEKYDKPDVYNVFTEKIRNNRTCNDLGVKNYRCICDGFYEVDLESWDTESIEGKFSELIFNFFETRTKKDSCAKLASIKLLKVKKLEVQPERKGLITYYENLYKLNNKVEMKALFLYCVKENVKKPHGFIQSDLMPSITYDGPREKTLIQLQEVTLRVACGDKSCLCDSHTLSFSTQQ